MSGKKVNSARHRFAPRLVPQMPVNAEIHLGTRNGYEYLQSPIHEIAQEVGRER